MSTCHLLAAAGVLASPPGTGGPASSSAALPRPRARHPWPERDLTVLATLLLSGLRSTELLTLTVGSVTGAAGERRIHVIGKGGKARSVPIEDSQQLSR